MPDELAARLHGARRPLRRPRSASATRRSRGASPATTSTTCCRRTASTSRARSSAPRAPASPCSRRPSHLIDEPALPLARRRRLPRRRVPRPTTCSRCSSTSRSGLEGRRRAAHRGHDHARHPPSTSSRSSPDGHGWLVIEVGGDTKDEADEKARAIMRDAREGGRRARRARSSTTTRTARSTSGRCARPASARPPSSRASPTRTRAGRTRPCRRSASASTCASSKKLADRYGYESALYGHYGQGCVHARWNFDLATREGIATWRRFLDEAADLVLSLGGSLSGEHGDGQARAELLPKMFGDRARRGVPRVQVDLGSRLEDEPRQGRRPVPRSTSNLRLGADYAPRAAGDALRVPARRRQLRARDASAASASANAARTEGGDVMCPSYMVTREEKHSTRGRAPPALGDARTARQLEGWQLGRGARRARPLPLVQGLHERLPGQRRHADATRPSSSPTTTQRRAAAAARLRVRA